MLLPVQIEPLDQLRARLHLALVREWNGDELRAAVQAMQRGRRPDDFDRPGKDRRYVFDASDGAEPTPGAVRLIISVERHSDTGRVLHLSGSIDGPLPGSAARKFQLVMIMFGSIVHGRTDVLPRDLATTWAPFVTEAGVVHVVFPLPADWRPPTERTDA